MWAKPFSGSRPTLDAWNIRQLYGSRPDYRVCFRELAVGIYGPASPITVASWETPCSNTALVRAYSDYIIRGLDLQVHEKMFLYSMLIPMFAMFTHESTTELHTLRPAKSK